MAAGTDVADFCGSTRLEVHPNIPITVMPLRSRCPDCGADHEWVMLEAGGEWFLTPDEARDIADALMTAVQSSSAASDLNKQRF